MLTQGSICGLISGHDQVQLLVPNAYIDSQLSSWNTAEYGVCARVFRAHLQLNLSLSATAVIYFIFTYILSTSEHNLMAWYASWKRHV